MTVKLFIKAALDFIFPPICHICHLFMPGAGELHICDGCCDRLPLVKSPLCPVCGIPFIGAGRNHICGHCQTHPPHFSSALAHLLYESSARELIHHFKYNHKTHLRLPLALLALEGLTEFITSRKPDIIIPVPLHHSRLRSRGFNQAVLLGNLFSSRLTIPMLKDGLTRTRETEAQIELSAEDRRNNVKGAFAANKPAMISGKRILLLDDVMTTGSTVNECAKVLKQNGAASVVVATIARAAR
jgi:ComF family protein